MPEMRHPGIRIKSIALLLLLILLVSSGIKALPAPPGGEVQLGNRVVMKISPAGKLSAKERAALITGRLMALIGKNWPVSDIHLLKEGADYSILWKDHLIIAVDPDLARMNHSLPEDLGNLWIKNLREAVLEYSLKVSKKSLTLPVGGFDDIELSGLVKGEIVVSYDSSLLSALVVQDKAMVTVTAKKAGRTEILIERGASKVSVSIVIKEWAGSVPDSAEMQVTGSPAPAELLSQAALYIANFYLELKPGARAYLRETPVIPDSLPAGDSTVVRLPLCLEGEDYYPLEKTVSVYLKNVSVVSARTNLLLVSNRPEGFDRAGILFKEIISGDKCTRLLYSHKNEANSDKIFEVVLRNETPKPVLLWVLNTRAGPDRDSLFVGHKAAVRFLDFFSKRAGFLIQIPPGGEAPLVRNTLAAENSIAGVLEFQILEGEELELEVKAHDSASYLDALPVIEETFDPFRIHPKGAFQEPDVSISVSYVAGSGEKTLDLVTGPWLIDHRTGEPNVGNYGAVYEINLSLENPASVGQRIGLYFVPAGGIASGSFIIEDNLLETPPVKPPQQVVLGSIELLSGEKRNLRIFTLPESGSFYPVKILMRSDPM